MLKRLKELRIKNSISISKLVDYLNISEKKYISYENGTSIPSIKELSMLAKLYNTSIDYILEETDLEIPYKKN